jgi:hypothetical protein
MGGGVATGAAAAVCHSANRDTPILLPVLRGQPAQQFQRAVVDSRTVPHNCARGTDGLPVGAKKNPMTPLATGTLRIASLKARELPSSEFT